MSNISNEEREKYYQYLLSDEWKNKKQSLINKRGDRCEKCFFKKPLDVHHKTYERIFNEPDEDLILLCRDCHKYHHRLSFE